MKNCRIGNAFPMGATLVGKKTVQFVSLINQKKEASLVLYENDPENNTSTTGKYVCTRLVIAALFVIVNYCKHPKCPHTREY